MNIMALFNALPGACAQGLIWGIMAIGVFITYKILDLADLTVDGTMCTGGAVCIMMMMSGHGNPGNSGRYSDPACLVFHQPENYGQ